MAVVNDYTALLSGNYWNGIEVTGQPVIVTFSFPTSLPAYDDTVAGFTPDTLASFQAFTSEEQAQAIQALNEWAAASGLVFVQVAPGQGDINFQNVNFNTTSSPSYAGYGGIGFYPFGDWSNLSYPNFTGDLDASGDVFMNSQFINNGTINYGTLLHEIGHAIGLKHPTEVVTDYAAQPDPVVHDQVLSSDDPDRTIMATVEDTTMGSDSHLQQLDKDAAAFLYGPAGTGGVYTTSVAGANSVSSWTWDAVTQTLTQTALATNETVRGTSVNDVIYGLSGDRLFALSGDDTLYGGGGNDALYGGSGTDLLVGGQGGNSFYVNSTTTTVEEDNTGSADTVYSTVSFTLPANVDTLYLYGQGLTGTGNNDDDTMYGDGTYSTVLIGGTGNDYIVGGAGNDTIMGGGGIDVMWGGEGDDTFVFHALSDAPVGGDLTTIGDFTPGQDKIDLSAIRTTGSDPGQPLSFIGTASFSDHAGQVREDTSGFYPVIEGDVNGDGTADFAIQLYGTPDLQSSDFIFGSVACYCTGTHILTEHGEVTVEALNVGDSVMTLFGHPRPIVWIGHRRIDCRRHPDPRRVWPVRVAQDAFRAGEPSRDLWLSPDHAVYVDDVFIPIRHLINGATIAQVPMDTVTYYHVELPQHDIVIAEGLPAESYLDTGNRSMFANGGGVMQLHPDFTPKTWRDDAAARLTNDEARVRPVWEFLAARAEELGCALPQSAFTDDPGVYLQVDGRTVRPVVTEANRCVFMLRQHAEQVQLMSRASYPTDSRPWIDDFRLLGIYVSRIIWHGADGPYDVPLDHPGLREGWWDVERAGDLLCRWTSGNALLPCPPDASMLEVQYASIMLYRVDTAAADQLSGVPVQRFARNEHLAA